MLQKDNVYHDIYIFSSQEAERPIINSLFNYSKEQLNNMLKKYFGINESSQSLAERQNKLEEDGSMSTSTKLRPRSVTMAKKKTKIVDDEDPDEFVELTHVNLAATSMIVFIRAKHQHLISRIQIQTLKLGTMGLIANKGAVSVSFKVGDHEMLLINCHLEAHEENRSRRNEQWLEIANSWCLGEENDSTKMAQKVRIKKRIDKRWDAIIWMGDFNSRIEEFSLPHPKTNQP
jgi:hypothetical protein